MKKKIILTLAVAAAALTTLNLSAGEPARSPKARANQVSTTTGISDDRLDRSIKGSAKAVNQAESTRAVAGVTPNLLPSGYVSKTFVGQTHIAAATK